MPQTLAVLFCLGVCLSQKISTPKEKLSKPTIWARPGVMVERGTSVTIWCKGAPEAVEYQLHFEGSLLDLKKLTSQESISKVQFLIPVMTLQTAGRYTCFYRSGELWSEPSNPLDLVVTGMYDTPKLWVHPGPEVRVGEIVTFYCRLEKATSMFFLLKEGRTNHTQRRHGNAQAEFSMGPATRAHQGTYRCFGSYNNHAWSFSSKPVMLLVTGDGNTSLELPDPTSPGDWELDDPTTVSRFHQDLTLWDHTTQNLIRMGLAFLVLVALVWLLAEEWLSGKRAQRTAGRVKSWECRRKWRMKCSPEDGPKGASPEPEAI